MVYALDTMSDAETKKRAKFMKRARVALGMTQKQLGAALGVHKNSVARMERGEFAIIRTTELAIKYLLIVESKTKGKKK